MRGMAENMAYDVASVRGLYPSLGDGWTYLNAHDCPQIPERVSSAVARSFRMSPGINQGGVIGASIIDAARHDLADLFGAVPEAVVFGPSLPVLYRTLADAMRPLLRYNSSVVLSGLDATALTTPFATAVEDVRWAQPDLGTGELPGWQYDELVDGSTRLVSLAGAHGLLGTVAPVREIADRVRAKSRAWVLIDASAYAPYRLIDIEASGADIIAVDLAQLGGPQLAALIFRAPSMFRRLDPLVDGKPEDSATKLETPIAPGLAGGVAPTVDHLAGLVPAEGDRRERLAISLEKMGDYLNHLRDELYLNLGSLNSVHILGKSGEAAADAEADRLPRLSFGVQGVPAETVQRRLIDNGLVTSVAPKERALTEMGADELHGVVTVSLGPFNTSVDIDHLVRTVASLA